MTQNKWAVVFLTVGMGIGLLSSGSSEAKPLRETWIHEGPVQKADLERWAAQPSELRDLMLVFEEPSAHDLSVLAELKGFRSVKVEAQRYPTRPQIPQWRRVADLGFEFVSISGQLPRSSQIPILNEIGFRKSTFVLSQFPSNFDSRQLAELKVPHAISINTKTLPIYRDKSGFDPIAETTPLLFAVDGWPFYNQMDFLNIIPQRVRLRVRYTAPSALGMEYLRNIKRLDQIAYQTFTPVKAEVWAMMPEVPMVWICKDFFPNQAALAAFEARYARSGGPSGSIRIDSDLPMTEAQRAVLEQSPVEIEWIHKISD